MLCLPVCVQHRHASWPQRGVADVGCPGTGVTLMRPHIDVENLTRILCSSQCLSYEPAPRLPGSSLLLLVFMEIHICCLVSSENESVIFSNFHLWLFPISLPFSFKENILQRIRSRAYPVTAYYRCVCFSSSTVSYS